MSDFFGEKTHVSCVEQYDVNVFWLEGDMKRWIKNMFAVAGTLIFGLMIFFSVLCLLYSCKPAEATSEDRYDENTRCPPGQWAIDTSNYYAYRHDCDPFESTHFTVYSDGSSPEAKRMLAEMAEEAFSQLVPEFLVQSTEGELGFTGDYTFWIFSTKHIEPATAMGFRNGFYMYAIDNARNPNVYYRDPRHYRYVIKHELTHVFQFTFTGCPTNEACPDWLGVWFREGQAVYMGGMGEEIRVKTQDELYDWMGDPGKVNPISIHRSWDVPDDRWGGYYEMFALAYTYLVDARFGYGATVSQMRFLFQLMKEGDPFDVAFEKALGISVAFYRDNFYVLMDDYLQKTQFTEK